MFPKLFFFSQMFWTARIFEVFPGSTLNQNGWFSSISRFKLNKNDWFPCISRFGTGSKWLVFQYFQFHKWPEWFVIQYFQILRWSKWGVFQYFQNAGFPIRADIHDVPFSTSPNPNFDQTHMILSKWGIPWTGYLVHQGSCQIGRVLGTSPPPPPGSSGWHSGQEAIVGVFKVEFDSYER